ncbi:MAG: hypothetical protein JSR46_10230 [Verrucomicrobia bacterium]|nr:hypothetical protein [Verrucomicrobiota bacterium]
MSFSVDTPTGLTVDPNARESLSYQTWNDLAKQAKEASVPYVMITVCYADKRISLYDTMHFLRSQQHEATIDPLTRLPIVKVEHLFAKTFEIVLHSDGRAELIPASSFDFHKFDPSLIDNLQQICLEANNPYVNNKEMRERAARYQYTIGVNLLRIAQEGRENVEAIINDAARWFLCSAIRGCAASSQAIVDQFPVLKHIDSLPK